MTGQGALVHVSAGPQRVVTRENIAPAATAGVLSIGAVDVSGTSALFDSSGGVSLSSSATCR